jgi:hypothetical protein
VPASKIPAAIHLSRFFCKVSATGRPPYFSGNT